MEIVRIEIPQRPGIVGIKKHTVRNRGLLFHLRLLVDHPLFALPFGQSMLPPASVSPIFLEPSYRSIFFFSIFSSSTPLCCQRTRHRSIGPHVNLRAPSRRGLHPRSVRSRPAAVSPRGERLRSRRGCWPCCADRAAPRSPLSRAPPALQADRRSRFVRSAPRLVSIAFRTQHFSRKRPPLGSRFDQR